MVVTHGTPLPGRGPSAWTIGNFDGVHLGHQAMLARVIAVARRRRLSAGVLSFEPLPREHFAARHADGAGPPRALPPPPAQRAQLEIAPARTHRRSERSG